MKKLTQILATAILMLSLNVSASTFEDFGQKAGLVKLMDQFMADLVSNEKTRPHFEKADQKRIKEQQKRITEEKQIK